MLSTVSQDVTFALRQFRRSPGFAIAAIVTLALGIRATTAIFTLADGILLRPLPFPDRDRLVAINTLGFPPGVLTTNPAAGEPIGTSYPNYFDGQRENHTFESIALGRTLSSEEEQPADATFLKSDDEFPDS
jgi:putative ABC transport system permease protein